MRGNTTEPFKMVIVEKSERQRKMVLIYSYKKADYRAGPFFNSKKGTKNFKNSSIYYF